MSADFGGQGAVTGNFPPRQSMDRAKDQGQDLILMRHLVRSEEHQLSQLALIG